MNDRKRGNDQTTAISLFYRTLSNRSFPKSSSQAPGRPGEHSCGNSQLWTTALVLCTYCTWSCKAGGMSITWCMLTSRCLQLKQLVMLVLQMLSTCLGRQGRNFALPTWFGDRLMRRVGKADCLLSIQALFHAPSYRRWNITMLLFPSQTTHSQSW